MLRPIQSYRFVFGARLLFIGCLATFAFAGCAPLPAYTLSPLPLDAVELPFETLSLSSDTAANEADLSTDPVIGVITTPSEIELWQRQLPHNAVELLKNVDYDHYFALLVYRGRSMCLPSDASRILQVVRQANRIRVFAYFPRDPLLGPTHPCVGSFSYPHHIVRIPKLDIGHGAFTFELMEGSQLVAAVKHEIP